MSRPATPAAERFWAKVDRSGGAGGCWIWTGCRVTGYGQFQTGTRKAPCLVLAHRYAWELLRCHNRACVNPAHLHVVTNRLNSENLRGAHRDSATGVRGVFWDKQKCKYRVEARSQERSFHGGFFSTVEEAEQAAIRLRNRVMVNNLRDQDQDLTGRPGSSLERI